MTDDIAHEPTIEERLAALEARAACVHNLHNDFYVQAMRLGVNGIDVHIKEVPFGAKVMVATNIVWNIRVCPKCGFWRTSTADELAANRIIHGSGNNASG